MTARAGMASLILELRGMCSVGTADYSVAGVPYWSDDQLQQQLDRRRETYLRVPLEPEPVYVDGSYQYFAYEIEDEIGRHFEQASTDGAFVVRNSSGGTATGYTVNYEAGEITFTADQANAVYYLDCRVYDIRRVAADVWEWKAGHAADRVDFQSDNHKFSLSDEFDHCMGLAKSFRKQAGVVTSTFVREDEI